MGERTRSGFPIPSDRNPWDLPPELVFPWDQAATLVSVAERVGVYAVRTQIETIRKILGNPNAVTDVTEAWQKAATNLTQSVDGSGDGNGLNTAKAELTARWNGTSREAVVTYVDNLIAVSKQEQEIVANIATLINNFRSAIVDNYIQAIGHIARYAEIVLDVSGDLLDVGIDVIVTFFTRGVKGGGDAKLGFLVQALGDFLAETSEVIKTVMVFQRDTQAAITDILSSATGIAVPSAIAPSSRDLTGWQPRNPTGSAWGKPT